MTALRERASPNHDGRGAAMRIDMLVLHYTGMTSAAAALERLCDAAARVSAHYLVEEDGVLWRLVAEDRRAWHAGISHWQGESDLNAVSLGIEIVNPGHEWGYRPFPPPQMDTVERLCLDLLRRHPIPPWRVVGHSDIAPDRKTDPGELFDWPRLARSGVGIWPEPTRALAAGPPSRDQAAADLAAIGYRIAPDLEAAALTAFQRRFRPALCDGALDPETATRLAEVRRAYDRARIG